MDMKEEMMNDAIDDAMEDADDEEETEEIVNKVLEEIGINLDTQVRGLSSVYPFPKLTTHRYLSFFTDGCHPFHAGGQGQERGCGNRPRRPAAGKAGEPPSRVTHIVL